MAIVRTLVRLRRHVFRSDTVFSSSTVMYIHARIQEFSSRGGGRGRVQAPLTEKSSDVLFSFFVYLFSPQLILQRKSNDGFFKEYYHCTLFFQYSREEGDPTFSRGINFFRGRGSNCLILHKSIELVITRGSGPSAPPPPPPLWILA